jgi:hypothetical protein
MLRQAYRLSLNNSQKSWRGWSAPRLRYISIAKTPQRSEARQGRSLRADRVRQGVYVLAVGYHGNTSKDCPAE